MTVQRNRCQWCAELQNEKIPGAYKCGTVGENRGYQCYKDCGHKIPHELKLASRRKPKEEHLPGGRRRSPERVQIESMKLGETRHFPSGKSKLVRFVQCLIAQRNDGTSLVVRDNDTQVTANYVPRIDDMQPGESRLYTDDFSLMLRLIVNKNTRHLRGRESRIYSFDLIDGIYWLRRLV